MIESHLVEKSIYMAFYYYMDQSSLFTNTHTYINSLWINFVNLIYNCPKRIHIFTYISAFG